MPRKLHNSKTLLWSNATIAGTLFFCGLIPSWNNTYPRYYVSVAQNDDLHALTFSCASCNLIKTLISLLRWSSRLPLVVHNRSSIQVLWPLNHKMTACVVLLLCLLLTQPIILLPPLQNGYQFCTQKFNITCCRHHLCKTSYRHITTRTECICADIPYTNDWNTTSGTTSHSRQYLGPNISIWCHI
jgi:hypothetical protein